ncbi:MULTISPECIES: hypothetical protein [unclassified Microbacterium]|uniref:hypothetical protein n=1 Tax=unclassified Microbacterium TaxID=2609290 RepID=UPI00214B7AF1|nr:MULTISPECIES: hypothetical protein [unclassified Microbacterium]MCR2785471.1 hypothetical protein [Microbacterium sp. zg.B96]WIM17537.1 hypothetical protein QNO11_07900 [Microbacterium sp. zg-B96]
MSSAHSRSNAAPLSAALAAAVDVLVGAVRALDAGSATVLIDGRSGAGKSTLARDLVARWPQSARVQLVALDSLYPGWDGLAAGATYAREQILQPHRHGLPGAWRRWDWATDMRAEEHAVDPSLPLVIEGSGILTPQTAALADIRVWLESPEPSRKARAMGRDGDTYRPHWERWAEQEERHLARDTPRALATHLFDVP